MAFPNVKNFGIVDNPLIDSPFIISDENGSGGVPPLPRNRFLLMTGASFLLMTGADLLLMET